MNRNSKTGPQRGAPERTRGAAGERSLPRENHLCLVWRALWLSAAVRAALSNAVSCFSLVAMNFSLARVLVLAWIAGSSSLAWGAPCDPISAWLDAATAPWHDESATAASSPSAASCRCLAMEVPAEMAGILEPLRRELQRRLAGGPPLTVAEGGTGWAELASCARESGCRTALRVVATAERADGADGGASRAWAIALEERHVYSTIWDSPQVPEGATLRRAEAALPMDAATRAALRAWGYRVAVGSAPLGWTPAPAWLAAEGVSVGLPLSDVLDLACATPHTGHFPRMCAALTEDALWILDESTLQSARLPLAAAELPRSPSRALAGWLAWVDAGPLPGTVSLLASTSRLRGVVAADFDSHGHRLGGVRAWSQAAPAERVVGRGVNQGGDRVAALGVLEEGTDVVQSGTLRWSLTSDAPLPSSRRGAVHRADGSRGFADRPGWFATSAWVLDANQVVVLTRAREASAAHSAGSVACTFDPLGHGELHLFDVDARVSGGDAVRVWSVRRREWTLQWEQSTPAVLAASAVDWDGDGRQSVVIVLAGDAPAGGAAAGTAGGAANWAQLSVLVGGI